MVKSHHAETLRTLLETKASATTKAMARKRRRRGAPDVASPGVGSVAPFPPTRALPPSVPLPPAPVIMRTYPPGPSSLTRSRPHASNRTSTGRNPVAHRAPSPLPFFMTSMGVTSATFPPSTAPAEVTPLEPSRSTRTAYSTSAWDRTATSTRTATGRG